METNTNGEISAHHSDPTQLDKRIFLVGILTFFSILATAVLHSNDREFFNALFAQMGISLSEELVIQYGSIYDSVYYLSFIAGLIIGPISDHKGKRKIFIIGGSILFVISSLVMVFSPNFGFLIIFRLIQGIGHIAVWQTLMVLVYDLSTPKNVAKSVAIYTIFMGSAMGFGTIGGGLLADIGVFVPISFSICAYIVVLVISIIGVREPKKHYILPSVKQGIRLIYENPRLVVPSIFNFVDRLHMGFLVSLVPLYLTYVIPLSPGLRGMIYGISALPSIFLSYPVGKKSDASWGRFKPLIWGSLSYGVMLSLTGFLSGNSLPIFVILLILQGCAQGFTTTPASSLIGDIIDQERRATAVSIFNLFGNLGIIVGPLLILLFGTNFAFAFLMAGLIELGSLGLNVLLARRMQFLNF